jgi:hypothetical protein
MRFAHGRSMRKTAGGHRGCAGQRAARHAENA